MRHIESVMRMAEARARMHLRESVREDDVDAAIGERHFVLVVRIHTRGGSEGYPHPPLCTMFGPSRGAASTVSGVTSSLMDYAYTWYSTRTLLNSYSTSPQLVDSLSNHALYCTGLLYHSIVSLEAILLHSCVSSSCRIDLESVSLWGILICCRETRSRSVKTYWRVCT